MRAPAGANLARCRCFDYPVGMPVLALAALAALIFGPLARAGFVYDDVWFLVKNPAIRRVAPLTFLLRPETGAAPGSGLALGNFRPLATLSLAFDYRLWELRPGLYHLENAAWHLLNACLVLALSRRWLKSRAGAWVAACVFLVHPVQVETVAWISQRSNLLCAAALLASLLLLTKDRDEPVALGAGLATYAAALYAKEEALVLPLLVLLCDALRSGRLSKSLKERHRVYAALSAVTAVYALSRMVIGHPWSQFEAGRPSIRTDLMLGAVSFAVYLGKLVFPVALRPSYDYPAFSAWAVAGGFALLPAYAFACGWACGRRSALGLALAWAAIALLPVLHLVPLRPFVAERFLYLSAAGAGLAAGWLYERGGIWRWAVAAWIVGLAGQAAATVPHWKDERSLWAAAVAAQPSNAFARVCYAQTLDEPAQAEGQYKAALTAQPSEASRFAALNNLSNVMLRAGKPRQAGYWARLAAREQPGEVHALYNLCRAYEAAGDPRSGAACAALRRRRTEPSLP